MKNKIQPNLPSLAFTLNFFVTIVSIYLVTEAGHLFLFQNGNGYHLQWLPFIPAVFTGVSFYHWRYLNKHHRHDTNKAHTVNALLIAVSILLYFILPKVAYMPAHHMFASFS